MGRIPLCLFCGSMLLLPLATPAGGDELASGSGRRTDAPKGARLQIPAAPAPARGSLGEPPATGGMQLPLPEPGVPIVDAPGAPHAGWSGFLGSFEPYVRGLIERARPAAIRRAAPPPAELPGGAGLPGGDVSLTPPSGRTGDGAGAAAELPTRFAFGPLSPNPSTGPVTFRFELPVAALVRITVVDVAGRVIHEYRDQRVAGRHTHEWTGRDRAGRMGPSGVYFALLEANGRTIGTKRMVILQ